MRQSLRRTTFTVEPRVRVTRAADDLAGMDQPIENGEKLVVVDRNHIVDIIMASCRAGRVVVTTAQTGNSRSQDAAKDDSARRLCVALDVQC